MLRILWIFVAVLVGCTSSQSSRSLEHRIDVLFDAYTQGNRPGYSIGIIRNEELIFAKGYGVADLQTGEQIRSDTAFNIASLSKQFTGAAVAFEIRKGTISLDDKFQEHWPELPEFMAEISIGHLVYMTSGLKEYYTLPSPKGGWASENEFTVQDAISAVLASSELDYAPGTRWSYSNINYQLLAKLCADLNQTDFNLLLKSTVFDPLGMQNSWVDAPLDRDRKPQARSYNWSDEVGGWKESPRLSPHYGGSGIFSSVEDLAKWDIELSRGKVFGEGFATQMLATKRYAHEKSNDAFGLVHGQYRGLKTIWYEGGDYGASAYMVRLPERSQTIICLSNFGDGRCAEKARAVLDLLIAFEDI